LQKVVVLLCVFACFMRRFCKYKTASLYEYMRENWGFFFVYIICDKTPGSVIAKLWLIFRAPESEIRAEDLDERPIATR
jgi:hypothetical protein